MKKESNVFIFFLFVNITLSINCFFYNYAGRKAAIARTDRKTTKIITETEQTILFSKINKVKLESIDPYIVHFYMLDNNDLCFDLFLETGKTNKIDLQPCPRKEIPDTAISQWFQSNDGKFADNFDTSELIINPRFPNNIFQKSINQKSLSVYSFDKMNRVLIKTKTFKEREKEYDDFLRPGKEKLQENNYNSILCIRSNNYEKNFFLVFNKKESTKKKVHYLNFDGNVIYKTSGGDRSIFWETMTVVGYIVDVITIPIQVVVGFLYIMIFGIK